MSKVSKQLEKQRVTLARKGQGSSKTVAERSRSAEGFSERLATLNTQSRDVKQITTVHNQNNSTRPQNKNRSSSTLQN
ncbi:phage integrase N-terminal domain-containing protein, partial [Salmonella enterica]|uniref:phage integrase N-terminal domain-containing protein n=1 Tax=Salmonella enterica TaxID=28901 RepID=UPI00398C59F8